MSSNELFICPRVYSSYDTLFRVIRKYGAKLILDIYNYGMAYSGNYEIRNEGLYDAYWLWLTPFETFLSPKIVQKPKINKKKMFPREFFSENMVIRKDEDDYYYYTRL